MSLSVLQHRPRWRLTELSESLLSPPVRRVVLRWLTEGRFADDSQEPALLPLAGEGEPGFTQLVQAPNRELSPQKVLDELLGTGLADHCEDTGMVLLRRTAYRSCLGGEPVAGAPIARGPGPAGPWRRRMDRQFGT
ncbi:MAG: hypothetical protein R3280_08630 [Marinobacter sp.]|uniref:hypothetical protein n=1 Tax=Marinobacter sp. TaxID=50741 RepID=UPI00299E2861|nr:hypothetical protein [Marinobacter sp.]MDX1634688.1 hypothetical protein [Marinobacter sp.]